MSARVFNPLVMSEMRRVLGRSSSDGSGTTTTVARVRRDLFGPVNHEDAQLFVDRELAAMRTRESEKWGFDFVKETPLDNSRFCWERVSPEENFPEAYALRRLTFVGQQAELGQSTKEAASMSTTTAQGTTTAKSANKQSHITDYLKCRKRSLSAGDISRRKIGSVAAAAAGDFSTGKVGTSTSLSEPSKRKRKIRQ